jgi:tripartite-type tricarboxylate transporter receptor subunit TctC
LLIAARRDFPASNLKEFITFVKKNAGKLNVSHAGVGSVFFTTCLLVNALLEVTPTFVPSTVALKR